MGKIGKAREKGRVGETMGRESDKSGEDERE